MQKFIIKTTLFFIVLIAVNMLIYILIYKPYIDNYGKVNNNYNTYILGDSHAIHLGQLLNKKGIYNFSEGGDSYQDMLWKLDYLIQNSQVKKVLLEVDDHTLSDVKEQSNNTDRSIIYANQNHFKNKFDYLKNGYLIRYIPLLNPKIKFMLQFSVLSLFDSVTTQTTTVNWLQLPNKKQEAQNRAKDYFSGIYSLPVEGILKEIMVHCKRHHVQLIGIKYPLTGIYFNMIKDNRYRADSIFYKANLKVIDFTSIFANNDTLFTNQDHLNEAGGRRLADSLTTKLKELGVNK